jgi:uncharacterized integral membrane protein (TIGR00698 family)
MLMKISFFISAILLVVILPFFVPSLADMRPAIALLLGIVLASTTGNPFPQQTKKWTPKLLGLSVVGLGFGMNFLNILKVGYEGIGYTVSGIVLCLLLGKGLATVFKTTGETSFLIAIGTAICGGSAIAAVSPVIRAKDQSITVAMGTVFILNALALLLFPRIGHFLHLTQEQFGLWSALAIHDTSSVVGASMQYGARALQVGTTIKLTRALWIIPLTLLIAWGFARKESKQSSSILKKADKIKKPWFIVGLLMAAAISTWVPGFEEMAHLLKEASKILLGVTLFGIGINLNLKTLKEIGVRPLLFGVVLWLVVASVSLLAIKSSIIGV